MNIEKNIIPEEEKKVLLNTYIPRNNLAEVFNDKDIDLYKQFSIAVYTLMDFNMRIGNQFDNELSFEGLKSYFTKNTQSLVGYFTGLSLKANHFNTVMQSDLTKEFKFEFFANSLTFDFINQIQDKQKIFDEFIEDLDSSLQEKQIMLATVSIILNSQFLSKGQYHSLMDSIYGYTSKEESYTGEVKSYSYNPALELLLVSASSPITRDWVKKEYYEFTDDQFGVWYDEGLKGELIASKIELFPEV